MPASSATAASAAAHPSFSPSLEALLHEQVWRASSLGACDRRCVSSGFAALDAELPGGGWPTRALSEILLSPHAALEWRLLGPALRGLLAAPLAVAPAQGRARAAAARPSAQRPLLLINPPLTPHLPGLRDCGLGPQQLIWIAPATPQQQLWATEQALKANAAAAILAWLPQARAEQIRRLQACALASDAPVFLFRPWAAQQQSSAAPLRLLLTPGTAWSLDVRLLKRRGPAHEGCLSLPSVPSELAALLTPRMLAPAPLPPRAPARAVAMPPTEPHDALARPAAALHLARR